MKKTVIFDLDGTLIDTAPDLIRCLSWLMEQEGLPPVNISQAKSLIGAGIKPMIMKALQANGRGQSHDEIEVVYGKYLVKYEAEIALHSRPYPHITDQLVKLKAQGYQLGVCTNKIERLARILLDELDMTKHFDAITGVDTFDFKKPDARHMLETVRLAGGDEAHSIMIGDSKTDINTAHNAKRPVIAYIHGYTDIPLEELNPTVILDSYERLDEVIATLLSRHNNPA
jgi:phosphoglycolate phosphatase